MIEEAHHSNEDKTDFTEAAGVEGYASDMHDYTNTVAELGVAQH